MANTELCVLITGGAGFIGSHLCERVLQNGHEVLCVHNSCSGTRFNTQHRPSHAFELMRYDVCSALYVEVDEFYNLAYPASLIHYQFQSGADDQDRCSRCH
jgi:UDP-glucuronate decarboxylase